MKGYINSFTDFFYLTHRHDSSTTSATADPSSAPSSVPCSAPPASAQSGDGDAPALVRPSSVAIPVSSLPVIASHLSLAESSHRHASPLPIFSSYGHLASFFSSLRDYKTAVYFQEKVLELAETLNAHSHTALTALAALGSLYEAMDQPRVAISYFERCGQWANAVQSSSSASSSPADAELVTRAKHALVQAYQRHAGEHERSLDFPRALEFYGRCIDAARDTGDSEAEMHALYHLALIAHQAQPDTPTEAVPHLQTALMLARQAGAPLECSVLLQLAAVYQRSGELNLAVHYLEEGYAVAVRIRDEALQGECMGRLGEVYSLQGEHKEGMRMFEKCYELAKKNGERRLMEVARINVGKARANVFMRQFMALMDGEEEMKTLMSWKTKRQGLKLST